ncbi:Hypothetical predicted protein [Paramuricea clavata]|uniref:Uncharacterized protein n=1 Tax=Paramuricea clavata TaxID=317549 RepID=A0A7D9ER45_PARCT|nr:Hypothetical predicted protein [Paramuricea clavata]
MARSNISAIKHQLTCLKSDCALFSRLYIIACRTREVDLFEFFQHENQPCPPSLSNVGKPLLPGNKTDLIDCLEPHHQSNTEAPSYVDATIIDGSAIVNMINSGTARAFQRYAEKSIGPYIESQLQYSSRVDVIWDRYINNSLMALTRSKRGTGIRR